MTYIRPNLVGFSAMAVIRETGPDAKTFDPNEIMVDQPSDPAYQADE
jgi:hypothetical protein